MNQGLLDQIRPVMRRLQRIRFSRTFALIGVVTAIAGWSISIGRSEICLNASPSPRVQLKPPYLQRFEITIDRFF